MVGLDGKVSIEKKLCISLLTSKKVLKGFVHEPISCFSDSDMFRNIMNIIWV